MLRFAALNESESDEEENDQQDEAVTTKEAKEAEAFAVYSRALGLQRSGDGEGAEELFRSLLQHPYLLKAGQIVEAEGDSHHPGLPLLYLVHKNMAAAAVNRNDLEGAMKFYLKAVQIDASEVTVWYKMGSVAKKLHNYPLARLALEQGLQCSEHHWPCLDAVITILYSLNDYWMCLDYCGRALERDPYYVKGLVFMRQIMKEQPSLRTDAKDLFAYCDPIIHTEPVEVSLAEKMIQECVEIRDKRRELAKRPEPEPLRLPKPIKELTWKCVGESLVDMYDSFTSSNPPKSLVLSVDMSEDAATTEGKVADHGEAISTQPSTSTLQGEPNPKSPPAATTTTTTATTAAASSSPHPASLIDRTEKMEVEPVSNINSLLLSACDVKDSKHEQKEEPMAVSETGHAGMDVCEKGSSAESKSNLLDSAAGVDPVSAVTDREQVLETKEAGKSGVILKSEVEGALPGDVKQTQDVLTTESTPKMSDTPGNEGKAERSDLIKQSSQGFDTSSEPVSMLLKSIKAEKDSLTTEDTSPSVAIPCQVSSSETSVTLTSEMKESGTGSPSSVIKDGVGAVPVSSVLTGNSGVYTTATVPLSTVTVSHTPRPATDPDVTESAVPPHSSDSNHAEGKADDGGREGQTGREVAPPPQELKVIVDSASGSVGTPCSAQSATDSHNSPAKQAASSCGSRTPELSVPDAEMGHSVTTAISVCVAQTVSASPSAPVTSTCPASQSAGGTGPSTSADASPLSIPSRPSPTPTLPKFQFNTITTQEVQALLQDCVPTTPLLSSPAPSPYSSSLVERFKQSSTFSPSPSSTASAQLQSLARLADPTNSMASSKTEVVSSPGPPTEKTADVTAPSVLSPFSSQPSPVSSTPVSAEVALQDHVGMGRGSKGARRGTKRKRSAAESRRGIIGPEDYAIKRRSARVRNTRKEEENVDFQKLLRKFLPSTLKQTLSEEEETPAEDSMSVSQVPADVTNTDLCGGPPLEETEEEDVRGFLQECVNNQGVVALMYKYLVHLSTRDDRLWPTGVTVLYQKVYERVRDHLTFPSLFCMDFPEICYTEMFKMILVWMELKLDAFLVKRADTVVSPASGQRQGEGGSPSESGLFAGIECEEDLLFVTGMVESGMGEFLAEQQAQFAMRVYWVKGRWALAENQMDTAVDMLDRVGDCVREEGAVSKVYLPNCCQDKVISLDEVKRQLESLKRCQSLEESQRLFDTKQYQLVVESLTATFAPGQATHRAMKSTLPERHAQLELLQDALYRLEDWGKCLLWGEVVLDEALHHYRRAPTVAVRDSWAMTLVHLFEGLKRVLDKDVQALRSLPLRSLIRLTQNLMRIIEINHDVSEAVTDMPIASVLPWMLLYRIIRHEEEKLEEMKIGDEDNADGAQAAISSSLMLLSVAHEYLGRNTWCTREDGAFLLFYLNILTKVLPTAHQAVKDDLETAFEQCVFCLYGHPNKKAKARHLFDHNAPCIDLTWDQCAAVFDYFKPRSLPEFDSYKTSTVSAELENLLRRICALIQETDETNQRMNQVHEFIEGDTNAAPSFSSSSPILEELYYLLADYYFKNKEQAKAIKFYIHDVCFNSGRIDSWAGLALAKMSQLEQKLNSMELKIDVPIHKKSIPALRCFSRAVEIDETVRKLWIEYGSLAYQLHSHASRQLRMKLWFTMTPELLDIAMETRVEMLATARNCYWKASKCEAEGSEEEWLHHYMMGKVMEKQRAHPRLYLEHYKQAAIYLHEEEAKYPRKIMYHASPPHLSLEALEMYYRLHMAVMKHLLRVCKPETREDMALFDRYVTEATESPFALRKEKRYEIQECVSSADDSQCSVTSAPPYSTTHQKPVYHMTPQDHNYSKQKSSGGETSDASCEVKETETDGSQSSEEIEGNVKSPRQTSTGSERQTGVQGAIGPAGTGMTDMGGGGKESRGRGDPLSPMTEVMELHAETDSQVSVHSTDPRPLLSDKQISGGFIPTLDKSLHLPGSVPSTSQPLSSIVTATTTNPQTVTTASGRLSERQVKIEAETSGDDSEALDKEKTSVSKQRDSAEDDTGDKHSDAGEIFSQAEVKASEPDSGKEKESITGKVTAPLKEAAELSESLCPEMDGTKKDGPPSVSSDHSVNVILSSEEHTQDDESLISPVGSPIVISSDDDLWSGTPSRKRPGQASPEGSKRQRLEDSAAEETATAVHRGDGKASGVNRAEGCVGIHASEADMAMKTQEPMLGLSAEVRAESAVEKMIVDEEKVGKSAVTTEPDAGEGHPSCSGKKEAEMTAPEMTTNTLAGSHPPQSQEAANVKGMLTPVLENIDGMGMKTEPSAEHKGGQSGEQKNSNTAGTEQKSNTAPSIQSDPKGTESNQPEVKPSASRTEPKIEPSCSEKDSSELRQSGKEPSEPSQEKELSAVQGGQATPDPTQSTGKRDTAAPSQPQPAAPRQSSGPAGSGQSEQETSTQDAHRSASSTPGLTETSAKTAEQKSPPATRPEAAVLGEKEYKAWKKTLLDKCIDGLHLCLSRFPTHYKSLYRLSYLYYASETHRNLVFARDLLLGNPNWQSLKHMPANGLFCDRKSNNFFNGTWRIPIEEIDRSGSFASHINRSVQLLLEVLRDLGDVSMLLTLHNQLKKKPSDQTRKYLRDGERQVLAQMAHSYILDAVATLFKNLEMDKTEVLLLAFKAYNVHRHGVEAQRAMMLLVAAYHRLGLPKQGYGLPVEQAIQYCNSLIASQVLAQKAEKSRLLSQSAASTSSGSPCSGTSHTVDAGTTPNPILTPHKPQSPAHSGIAMASQTSSAVSSQHPVASSAHESHHSFSAGVQASTLRPAHTMTSRARTMSASREDFPVAVDVGSNYRQYHAAAALDLSTSSRQMTTVSRSQAVGLTSTSQRSFSGNPVTESGSQVEGRVLGLPEGGLGSSRSVQTLSPGSKQRLHPVSGATSALSPRVARDPLASPGSGYLHPKGMTSGPLRSPGSVRTGLPAMTVPAKSQSTSLGPRPPLSPFTASQGFQSPPSAASSTTSPRHHASMMDEASDLDKSMDQEDDLALTSPDRLTSDIRHHFQGDLL